MKQRGLVGTSYVYLSGRNINWEDLYEMVRYGWDMQCHSYSHTNLTELTEAQLHEEMQMHNAAFVERGLKPAEHHAYPLGAWNATVKSVLTQYRKTLRRTGYVAENVLPYEDVEYTGLLPVHADIASPERMQVVKDAIDRAKAINGVLITYTHSIVDEITDSYQCLQTYFEEMLDYAMSKGLRFVTVSQLYNILRFHRLVYGGEMV